MSESMPVPADPAAIDALAAGVTSGRWPPRLADMTDLLIDEIARTVPRLPAPDGRRLAVAIVVRLVQEFGGQNWYWLKPRALERILRDLSIWAEHDGTVDGPHGIAALARKYGCRPNRIWFILSQERAMHRRARNTAD